MSRDWYDSLTRRICLLGISNARIKDPIAGRFTLLVFRNTEMECGNPILRKRNLGRVIILLTSSLLGAALFCRNDLSLRVTAWESYSLAGVSFAVWSEVASLEEWTARCREIGTNRRSYVIVTQSVERFPSLLRNLRRSYCRRTFRQPI